MAANQIGYNQEFPIYNADGTPFNNLVLRKSVVDSVIMSLGDKVSGDVYYKDNSLVVTMSEYVEIDGVKYTLVNPPTIVREGIVSDNGDMNGMTKYSFEFYHPMYMLGDMPFADVAVTSDERKYLSQNKTFSWIGTFVEFIAKMDANLASTEWKVIYLDSVPQDKLTKLSEVMTFDKQFMGDACKKCYETWEVPFTITQIKEGENYYSDGKRYLISFGLPSQEIYEIDEHGEKTATPFIFKFGKGVGLKNNSRTPKNNKIVTRLAGTGAERNVPFGYPQIPWTGDASWEYTINNDASATNSYPIYDGIVGGQKVRLIKHPFTRSTLMPSIYAETVNKKVNPNATGYDPDIEIVDYYDAIDINPLAPSFESHQFEDIYPRLGNATLVQVLPYDDNEYISLNEFHTMINGYISSAQNENEKSALNDCYGYVDLGIIDFNASGNGGSYTYKYYGQKHDYTDGSWYNVVYTSSNVNFKVNVYKGQRSPGVIVVWDDTTDDNGEYVQSYFKIKLPQLSFDLYASAAITEDMNINMRSGKCLGCSFPVQVDWEDYKKNFYDSDGNFAPDGSQRNLEKYPKSQNGEITIIVQKETQTFGTLMPNIYQQPAAGDEFVILGISLPTSYIIAAEAELDSAMQEYIVENGVPYYDYPLKFDEYFLATNQGILAQIQNNNIVRFQYAGSQMALYIKQITIKYGDNALPQYEITLTDDVEIVLNKIGQVTDDVSRMRVQVSELQKYYSENIINEINAKLSRIEDDICQGRITFRQGLSAIGNVIFSNEIKSNIYENGLYSGRGWRIDELGNAEFESARVRSFLEVVELIVNRMQAQEGDTLFTDNDQIDRVDKYVDETDDSVSYVLSLKEKYQGYVTTQMYGNVIKGIINTLAAKQAGVSDEASTSVEVDGENKYYTSWMRVIGTNATDNSLGVNQIRVVLYGDDQVPAQKNFEPCELMTIARWGCVDYSDPTDPDYESVKASIRKRQRLFMISNTDGRLIKHTGVDSPILVDGNYGVTIGELPEFVKNYGEVRQRVIEGRDYLYAQGVIVGDFIKVDVNGVPVSTNVYCGEWVKGDAQGVTPSVGNGIYLYNEYNETSQQYEIHQVSHEGMMWQCLQHQPVVSGGVSTYYEPKWNSPYWKLVNGNTNYTIEFVSSRGYSFRRGAVDTIITPYIFFGNIDITEDVDAQYINWTRYEERNVDAQGHITYTDADLAWNAQHTGFVLDAKTLHLTNEDMPTLWSSSNKAIFTCTITLNDGRTTIIVENQIIS